MRISKHPLDITLSAVAAYTVLIVCILSHPWLSAEARQSEILEYVFHKIFNEMLIDFRF